MEVEEGEPGSSEEVCRYLGEAPEVEEVQFSVLAFLILLRASFLMLFTEMLQRLKTGEPVVRESLSMSYREGI